eukprot:scaffold2625_cov30-Tisochrysis_lutea.AAC.1
MCRNRNGVLHPSIRGFSRLFFNLLERGVHLFTLVAECAEHGARSLRITKSEERIARIANSEHGE